MARGGISGHHVERADAVHRRSVDDRTAAPRRANKCAVARPIPDPAPVTIAVLPVNAVIGRLLPCGRAPSSERHRPGDHADAVGPRRALPHRRAIDLDRDCRLLADHPVFDQLLKSLVGYEKWWAIVECASIGVPQTRKRLVLLASRLGSTALELTKDTPQAATVRQVISALPPIRAGESHPDDELHMVPSLSPLNLSRIKASRPGGTWRDWPSELQAACHRKVTGATYPSVYGRMEWDRPAPTITTQCFGYGNGRFGHPEQNRAISLREAAMLQTFPATYKFAPAGASIRFNKMGRLIGNAVPVRLGEVIARSLVIHVQANTARCPRLKYQSACLMRS